MSLSNHLYLLGTVKLKGTRTNGHGLTVSMEYEDAATGAEVAVPPLGGTNTIERHEPMLFFMGKTDTSRLPQVLDFLCEPLAEERCASYGFAFLGVGWVVKETVKRPSTGNVKLLTRLQVDVSMHESNWLSVVLQKGIELEHVVAMPRDRDLLTHPTLEFGDGLLYRAEIERLCRLCTPAARQEPESNGDQPQLFEPAPHSDAAAPKACDDVDDAPAPLSVAELEERAWADAPSAEELIEAAYASDEPAAPAEPMLTDDQVQELVRYVEFRGDRVSVDELASRLSFWPLLPKGKKKRAWGIEVMQSLRTTSLEFDHELDPHAPPRVWLSAAARRVWIGQIVWVVSETLDKGRVDGIHGAYAKTIVKAVVDAGVMESPSWVQAAVVDELEKIGYMTRYGDTHSGPFVKCAMSDDAAADLLADIHVRRGGKPSAEAPAVPSESAEPAGQAESESDESAELEASKRRALVASAAKSIVHRADLGMVRLGMLRMRVRQQLGEAGEWPSLQELEDVLRERSDVFAITSTGTAQKAELAVSLR